MSSPKTPNRCVFVFLVLTMLFTMNSLSTTEAKTKVSTTPPENIIENSLKLLQSNGIKDTNDGILILKRYQFYLEEILKGDALPQFDGNKAPSIYDFLAFSNMMYKGTINKIVYNTLAGNDAFDDITGFFERAYISESDNTIDSYIIYLPKGYNSTKSYPLIILLHGYGESAYLSPFTAVHNSFLESCEKNNVIMVAPNGKHKIPYVSSYMNEGEDDVLQVLKLVRKSYNVDSNRIYLTGLSMGGFGTWYIGSRHHELFAAIAPVCGYGTGRWGQVPKIDINKLKDIPVMTFHGDNDDTVPVEETREMVALMKEKGFNITYNELPGVRHNAWDYAYQGNNLIEWFLKYSKKQP